MASEVLKIDDNDKPVAGAVTDDSNQFIKMMRIDDATKGLKVMLVGGVGAGTVTSVSVVTANGISGSVATATTTPAITLTLGAITPTTVNGITFSGSGSIANSGVTSLTAFTGSGTSSGTNSGDQTSVSGNAGTATALQNARTIGGVSFNGTANITVASATGGFTVSGGDLNSTGTRISKGWFTDIESTNIPTVGGTALLTSLTAPTFNTIELGTGQTDTTLSRSSAGVLAVEGVRVITSAGTTSGTILKNNGTTFVASTETYAAPGTTGNVMTSDGTNWTSAPASSGGFSMQDICLVTGTMTPTAFCMTSNTAGTVMYVAWADSSSTTVGNVARLLKDTTTGNYYITHATTFTISGTEIYSIMVLGSNVYVQCAVAATGALQRFSAADLTGSQAMTISGTNDWRGGFGSWSDNIQLYAFSTANNYRVYTVSGTTATAGTTISFTSAGSPAWAISNGTNMWCTDSALSGTVNIRKYAIAGGAVVSTTSPIIKAGGWVNGATASAGGFLGSSSILGIGWQYNICSEAAKVGEMMHIIAIALP